MEAISSLSPSDHALLSTRLGGILLESRGPGQAPGLFVRPDGVLVVGERLGDAGTRLFTAAEITEVLKGAFGLGKGDVDRLLLDLSENLVPQIEERATRALSRRAGGFRVDVSWHTIGYDVDLVRLLHADRSHKVLEPLVLALEEITRSFPGARDSLSDLRRVRVKAGAGMPAVKPIRLKHGKDDGRYYGLKLTLPFSRERQFGVQVIREAITASLTLRAAPRGHDRIDPSKFVVTDIVQGKGKVEVKGNIGSLDAFTFVLQECESFLNQQK